MEHRLSFYPSLFSYILKINLDFPPLSPTFILFYIFLERGKCLLVEEGGIRVSKYVTHPFPTLFFSRLHGGFNQNIDIKGHENLLSCFKS